MNEQLLEIAKEIDRRGGRSYLVGGSVRNELFGLKEGYTDIDVEVFGLGGGELCSVLAQFGEVKLVGQQFGVWMVNGMQFSLPRIDNKTGVGHKDFDVSVNPDMPIALAQARRDYTINAIYKNILTGEFVDNWGGFDDIKTRTLRHVSDLTFADDPLRVLRGVYLCGMLEIISSVETDKLAQEIADEMFTLSVERVWNEIWKWATKSKVPSMGLDFLASSDWIKNFPELYDLIELPIDHHFPAMDAWEYAKIAADNVVYVMKDLSEEDRGCMVLAAVLSYTGRAECTVLVSGTWMATGYEQYSLKQASNFLSFLKAPNRIQDKILEIIREHNITKFPNTKTVKRTIHRLKHNKAVDIVILNTCLNGGADYHTAWLNIIKEYGHLVPPIVKGKHLVKIGFKEGKGLGDILRDLHGDQLEGMFSTLRDGLIHLEEKYQFCINEDVRKEILDEL